MQRSENENILSAFSKKQVSEITGLSGQQLVAWENAGLFHPEIKSQDGERIIRIYSYKDVVGLKSLADLKKKFSIHVNILKNVVSQFKKEEIDAWVDKIACVENGQVHLHNKGDKTDKRRDNHIQIYKFGDAISDVKKSVKKLQERRSDQIGRFERKRNVQRNQEVIAGTRIPVSTICDFLDEGAPDKEILVQFPSLKRKDIAAVKEKRRMEAS